jgi:hypothetical protein
MKKHLSEESPEDKVVLSEESSKDKDDESIPVYQPRFIQWMHVVNLPNVGFVFHKSITVKAYVKDNEQSPWDYVCPDPNYIHWDEKEKIETGHYIRKLEKTIEIKHLENPNVWNK